MPADLTPPPSRLALTGATGRVARLIRPFLPDAIWLTRNTNPDAMRGADALVALAGVTRGDAAALAANTTTALDALAAARQLGVPRVFLLSSSAVYGRRPGPLRAEDAPTPAAPYGQAKSEMETAVTRWRDDTPDGPEAICLRLGNVAGADALLGNLQADRDPTLHIWPDGRSPRRSYIGPRTLARVLATLAALPAPLPPILNIGTPDMVEMEDLLRAAGRAFDPVPAPPEAIAQVALDCAPLARLVAMGPTDTDPTAMVAQWQEARA
ncbi:NAD(P)-dependent oxidoreductase [Jannaschia sp. M317]|uniref:NAD-dependent epimerase/dehydratase family protein n=1 Tax=Jannaschia sp. M317 TaxID=2867011 RepID=UPI0021A4F26F|nr:NAD-dependent epimerase/dehydratase family protein [Jannaschia sp. M317]UWQ18107.1 NAD-dependent epimerase/dehydratase family protein [Jannaschia sp. M317]